MQHPVPAPDDLLRAALDAERTAPPDPVALAEHLPDLEILALIGQGGMGAVYRARRRADGKLLALKVVRPVAGKEEAFAARFAREAEALERLHHPNIVAIHGHGQGGPWCWLLMDLVEGANLREIATTGRLSPAQTLALVPPLCAALQYAHDQGVVHRDLKPENILLDAAGVPHLVDFGLAKLRDGAAGSDLTNTGAGMGTMHYMAPEQVASAKDVDHRADIYALGVVIYELLTGQLPLGRFEAPSQRVQVDVRIDEVVLKALERDPQRRWQQMRQVGQAIATVDCGRPARNSWRLPRWVLVTCVIMLVIMLIPSTFSLKIACAIAVSVLVFISWLFVLIRQGRARLAWLTLGVLIGLLGFGIAAGGWLRHMPWSVADSRPIYLASSPQTLAAMLDEGSNWAQNALVIYQTGMPSQSRMDFEDLLDESIDLSYTGDDLEEALRRTLAGTNIVVFSHEPKAIQRIPLQLDMQHASRRSILRVIAWTAKVRFFYADGCLTAVAVRPSSTSGTHSTITQGSTTLVE